MTDAMFAIGVVAVTAGAWLHSTAAGIVVLGCWLCVIGVARAMKERTK